MLSFAQHPYFSIENNKTVFVQDPKDILKPFWMNQTRAFKSIALYEYND